MEDEAGFTDANLDKMPFPDTDATITYLKEMADRTGFRLSLQDKRSADRARMYCLIGNHCKGRKKSKKTGCPFHVTLIKSEGSMCHIAKARNLEHNHDLRIRRESTLTEEMQDVVRRMKGVGISAILICEFLRGKYGVPIMPVDVDSVSPDFEEASTMQETDDLRGKIAERNRAIHFFTVDSEFMSTRVACFTQTAQEDYNLREFGDVILLNGTAIDSHLT
jgi:hypothetical protein